MQQEAVAGWFAGQVPEGWFTGPPEVSADRDEILVVGALAEPELASGADDTTRQAARTARIQAFREDTRAQRMKVADRAEREFGRKVAWGATCGDVRAVFTTLSIPVMTRLRMQDRVVLDTLVDAGVARSRSDALAWCVRLVRDNQEEWITQLRDALVHVERVRAEGPRPNR
ncbi:MAG: hypothetical protein U0V73_00175 [Acidimicrobiia bacterium]